MSVNRKVTVPEGRSVIAPDDEPSAWPTRHADDAADADLHAHRVVPAVDVQRRAGDVAGVVAEEVRGGGADVVASM